MEAHPLAEASHEAPWTAPPPPPDAQVPPGAAGLQPLALQGRWREVAHRCRQLTATDTAAALSIGTYHVMALMRLHMFEDAAAEMGKLGSLEDPAWLGGAAQGGASLVPFALRVLRAELPGALGREQEAVDRLHALLDWCAAREAEAAEAAGPGEAAAGGGGGGATRGGGNADSAGGDASAAAVAAAAAAAAAGATSPERQLWRRRRRDVLLRLVNRHVRLGQHALALRLLSRQLGRDPSDAEAWSDAGLLMALLGDLSAAQHTLRHAEALLLQPAAAAAAAAQPAAAAAAATAAEPGQGQGGGEQRRRQALAHCNRGLLLLLQQDHRGARDAFSAALSADPSDAAAASNFSLALQYGCHLGDAAAALERAFRAHPAAMMQEAIVTNLASQYELMGSPAALAAKRRMADWVAAAAPDDFELAATKSA